MRKLLAAWSGSPAKCYEIRACVKNYYIILVKKMQPLFVLLSFLLAAAPGFCQVQEFYVQPGQTDASYPPQDSHLVAFNIANQNGKLLLFIGGTFSSPKNYDYITRHAASLGFAVINVTYPNDVLTTLLAGSGDSLAFNKFRQEICFGTQVSSAVNVDTFNSIYIRTLKLLQFLSQLSSHNWGRYLASDSTLDWSKILVSGHSQGAGHACYLAKKFDVERVVMFSGPNDYSTYFNNSAPWLRETGITPISRHFVFLHLQDEIVPFENQYANISGLGMLDAEDTILIDNLDSPFLNSHCLYSNHAPGSSGNYHNSTVIYTATPLDGSGNPIFVPVWDYMFTGDAATSSRDSRMLDFLCYPNPAMTIAAIESSGPIGEISIFNPAGQMIYSEYIPSMKSRIDLSGYQPGIYIVRQNGTVSRLIKK